MIRRAADRLWELSAHDQANAADRELVDQLHELAALLELGDKVKERFEGLFESLKGQDPPQ